MFWRGAAPAGSCPGLLGGPTQRSGGRFFLSSDLWVGKVVGRVLAAGGQSGFRELKSKQEPTLKASSASVCQSGLQHGSLICQMPWNSQLNQKADSTLRCCWASPHPSTNRALRRLTSELGRDPVHSTRYGRQRTPRSEQGPCLGGPSYKASVP